MLALVDLQGDYRTRPGRLGSDGAEPRLGLGQQGAEPRVLCLLRAMTELADQVAAPFAKIADARSETRAGPSRTLTSVNPSATSTWHSPAAAIDVPAHADERSLQLRDPTPFGALKSQGGRP